MKSDTLIARRDYALARTSSESRKENERERESVLSSPILSDALRRVVRQHRRSCYSYRSHISKYKN